MKFYDCTTAPSPRRVRIFLAEKGISVPTVQVDLRNNEQLKPEFRAINPDATVPVLELDNGTRITDAIGICIYFEATNPQPPLMGEGAEEKAVVAEWHRIAERNGFYAVMDALRNATPRLKDRALSGPDDYAQIPALAERGRARVARFFELMDARLAQSEFVAGARYSLADITALVSVDFARWVKLSVPEECKNLRRWHAQVSARPSANA
jgi:glutathione S-transferase